MKRKILTFVLLLSLIFSLFSCEFVRVTPPVQKRLFYDFFDTVGTFYDYSGVGDKTFSARADKVEEKLSEYHKLYDIYHEYEGIVNLATLNRLAGKGPQKVDKRIINLLLFAKEMYVVTGGEVNIAMGTVLKIWHDCRTEGVRIPTEEELNVAYAHTDIDNIIIDEENLTVELLDPEMRIDVGAIAKGYSVEMVADELRRDGVSGCVIDVGGNLSAIGTKPDGDGWSTGVKNPDRQEGGYVYTFTIKDCSAVTSGSYERFFEVGGKRYHHIIDKDTLFPSDFYTSVTVVCDNSALSDALSTALFNMDFEEAKTLVESLNGVFCVFVFEDGELRTVGEIC